MFYNNYVRLCNLIKKTPSAVAIEMGISKPTVTRWKSGSKPNHATALKVADYFGVPVEYMFADHEGNTFADAIDEDKQRIIEKIKALDTSDFCKVSNALEALLNIKL